MCVGGVPSQLQCAPHTYSCPPLWWKLGSTQKTTQSDTNTKPNKKKSLNKSLETQEENDVSLY